jgi:hypothetical protein
VTTVGWLDLAMEEAPTRSWSCNTLFRGSSFLQEQLAANKNASFDDIMGVSGLQQSLVNCNGSFASRGAVSKIRGPKL